MLGLRVVLWLALAAGANVYLGYSGQGSKVEETRDLALRQFEDDDRVAAAVRVSAYERTGQVLLVNAALAFSGLVIFSGDVYRAAKALKDA